MSTDLPKTYDPAAVEAAAFQTWIDEKCFHAEPSDGGKPYSVVIPPPNVTAALHLGHALNNTLQDIVVRQHRMMGDNTVWIPGTDHAGIATQTVVEKRVLAEEGKRRVDFDRDVFVAKIQTWKDEYERRITDQLKRMGCSCDWDRQAFTMDEPRAKAVREAFFRLFKDGLIYRGKRLVNWDPATQTALADDEVEMEEVDGHFYYLKYPIVEENSSPSPGIPGEGRGEGSLRYVTVATTRPETMLGDTAVAINPKDPRAAALRGKKVRLPIVDRIIPIIEDDYVVLPNPESDDAKARFATGFLKVTPAHDPNDYELGRRHNLDMINVMAPDGSISNKHGWTDVGGAEFLLGQDRYEARKSVVEWFRQNKLLEDVKPYRHTVGHSYRSHVAIEPYLSDQWYMKVTDDRLAGAANRALVADQRSTPSPGTPGEGGGEGSFSLAQNRSLQDDPSSVGQNPHPNPLPEYRVRGQEDWQGGLRFYPSRYAKTFQTWHENIRDWCISRQLWWGHRIPVWRGPEERILTLGLDLPQFSETAEVPINFFWGNDERKAQLALQLRNEQGSRILYICIQPGHDWAEKELESRGFIQDPDVLDTWFSSGLWPMSTFGWPEPSALSTQDSALNFYNPTSVLCTAREIITLWVSRMAMFNIYLLDRLPFTDVFIHAMIQDGEGRKMSKSLGNGVDPLDIIESHGADAMRFTLASMATNTQDVRMPVEKNAATGKNTSPKFDLGRNFCNKLWNAARFAIQNLTTAGTENTEKKPEINSSVNSMNSVSSGVNSLADRWILSRLARAIGDANESLKNYRFDQYAKNCYDFFWGDFCDWYVEAIKPAMRDPNRSAATSDVLAAVLDASLRLLHPVIPFITETIWWRLNEVRPNRGLAGKLESPPSKRLVKAQWPIADASLIDPQAEKDFARVQQVIAAVRNVRNEYKVDPKKPVTATIVSPEAARLINDNRELIDLLGTCKLAEVTPGAQPPADAVRTVAEGCEIYLIGLVDKSAELQRLQKKRDDLTRQIGALKGRMANEAYMAKAPPHLVKQTKDQLSQAETDLSQVENELKKLG